jgi:DNA (cytosine-5)-methyltransferase 1
MLNIKNIDKKFKGLKFVDLFSGIGGFHQALASFGADCVFACEIDKYAKQTYYENYKIAPLGDITKINEKEIPEHDILCAGFPCQAFSISGKQKGFSDTRGTLFFDIARIVKQKKPKILLLENVDNIKKHDNSNTYNTINNTLDELGYFCFDDIINSAYFGVPQKRKRIYFVCIRKDIFLCSQFKFPNAINKKAYVEDILQDKHMVKKYIINRQDVVFNDKKINQVILGGYEKVNFAPIRLGIIGKGGQGERIYSIKAPAITLSANGGGIASKTGAYKVGDTIRKLSPRECARLMGYSDGFKIPISDSSAWKQFGNSVVVDVVQHIIIELIKQGYNNKSLGRG